MKTFLWVEKYRPKSIDACVLPKNLKDVSAYINLIEGLIERGYSSQSIEKICYKNFFRVWNANLQNHQI